MRRKLVVLTLLLVATVSAAGAKPKIHIQKKNTCFNCGYCIGNHCYDCVQYDC